MLIHIELQVLYIELANNGSNMLSTGSGMIIWWDDTSHLAQAIEIETQRLEQVRQSQIEALTSQGKISTALSVAVEMNKPFLALDIIEKHIKSTCGNLFHEWVAEMKRSKDTECLSKALDFCVSYNTRAKSAWVAHALLHEMLEQYTPSELFKINGLADKINKILVHASGHLSRLMNLMEKSHLLKICSGLLGSKQNNNYNNKSNSTLNEILYN